MPKKKQPLKRRSAVVPQFETCGTEIHPEFIQNFLPRFKTFRYFLRVVFVV